MNCDVQVCFIDYAKVFEHYQYETIAKILDETCLAGKDIKIIANVYWK